MAYGRPWNGMAVLNINCTDTICHLMAMNNSYFHYGVTGPKGMNWYFFINTYWCFYRVFINHQCQLYFFVSYQFFGLAYNSFYMQLVPSGAIWRHRLKSALSEILPCFLKATSHTWTNNAILSFGTLTKIFNSEMLIKIQHFSLGKIHCYG